MAQPEVIKDIEARVKKSGDTMSNILHINTPDSLGVGLEITPVANNGEYGQINLNASLSVSNQNGIAIDNAGGTFRIYGIPSKDGTSKVGYGNTLQFDPYATGNSNVSFLLHSENFSSFLDGRYVLKTGDTMTGSLIINAADSSGLQPSLLKVISTNSANTTNSWTGRAIIGAKDLTFLMGTYRGLAGIGAHSWTDAINGSGAAWAPIYFNPDGAAPMYFGANGTGWTANSGTFIVQGSTTAGLGTITSNGISYFNNKVFIGNQIGKNELTIYGAFSNTDLGFQDGNDRPSLKILGHYPQIVLMAGGANNANHGPTISLGSYDSGTTGSFRTFTIGTQGINSTRLDIGFGTASNPHINCMNGFGGPPIIRFESDRRTYQYGMASFCNHAADTSYMNSAIQIREANYAGASTDSWGTAPRISFHWGGRVQTQIGLASNNELYISKDNFSSRYRIVYENGSNFNIQSYYLANQRAIRGATPPVYGAGYLEYFNTHSSICGGGITAAGNTSSTPTDDWYYIIRMNHENSGGYYSEIASCFHSNNMYWRRVASGTSTNWMRIWVEGNSVTGAVWNDYAECREADTIEPGYVLVETGDDSLTKSTERLSPFAGVSSDTWGFSQGETERAKTPIAVAGRVLVYPWQDRNNYKPGDCVCAAPEGKVDIMTREEIIQYPDRIVGTVSSIPTYDKWGGGENADREPVDVNGRIWIKVR